MANSNCAADYIEIPGALTSSITTTFTTNAAQNRFCGRILATQGATAQTTQCSRSCPFQMTVNFDDDEVLPTGTATYEADEAEGFPGGITGFRLAYAQSSC